jgi:hypothetical protein
MGYRVLNREILDDGKNFKTAFVVLLAMLVFSAAGEAFRHSVVIVRVTQPGRHGLVTAKKKSTAKKKATKTSLPSAPAKTRQPPSQSRRDSRGA